MINKSLKYTLIVALFFCTASSFAQTAKEDAFAATVKDVIGKLSRRDSVGLSRYIDKKTGVYILYGIGVKREWEHFPMPGFSDSSYPNGPFYDQVKAFPIKYASLPTYDCGTEKWSKKGLYVDTTKTDHLLSKTALFNIKTFGDTIPAATISKFKNLEAKSRRVVVAANNGHELIFYLSYINKKWVLTIIDKITWDCSV